MYKLYKMPRTETVVSSVIFVKEQTTMEKFSRGIGRIEMFRMLNAIRCKCGTTRRKNEDTAEKSRSGFSCC
ncbi:unnamed protein product [Amoebophrya sp. A120]|nr:unnamed protein product [Amoebophrya sp. A120]|eukprot:GSA120T00014593001.1